MPSKKSNGSSLTPKNAKKGTRLGRIFEYAINNLELNEEQIKTKELIEKNDLTFVTGKAGSGKTFISVCIGILMVLNKECERLIITRPTVSKEDIGHLPGTLEEKMEPWIAPIVDQLEKLVPKAELDKLYGENKIKTVPVQFMRGRTFVRDFVIIDECQNFDREQTTMILSRLGHGSKMVYCGDDKQIDLKYKKDSGYNYLYNVAKHVDGIGYIRLLENHRHPLVDAILNYTENDYLKNSKDEEE